MAAMLAEPSAAHRRHTAAPPAGWFFTTREQQLAWARRRFFEEGVRPTGLVDEALIQSWSRCLLARRSPGTPPEFNPVSARQRQTVLWRHRHLLRAAAGELQALQLALAGGPATVLLADARGTVLHAGLAPDPGRSPLLACAARVGVRLDEASVGTNAPDLALRCGAPVEVRGAEHFADAAQAVHCAAAPVRGPHGRIVAVLNLSAEGRPFAFDAAAVVALYASAIEHRLLLDGAGQALVLRLHVQAGLVDSPLAGLVSVDEQGRLRGCNAAARGLLGLPASGEPLQAAEAVLGLDRAALLGCARRDGPLPLQLPSGLQVWLRAQAATRGGDDGVADDRAADDRAANQGAADDGDGSAGAWPGATTDAPDAPDRGDAPAGPDGGADAAPPGPASLRDTHRALVARTLAECGGNVSAAARRLGVSRGLIYRHRGDAAAPAAAAGR